MIPGTNDKPPGFNWTEEERALLRRTLRVRKLSDAELEVETKKNTTLRILVVFVMLIVTFQGLTIMLAIIAGEAIVRDTAGIQIYPTLLFEMAGMGFMMMIGLPSQGRGEPTVPVTFFPGTPWFVLHRSGQKGLGLLRGADPDNGLRFTEPVALESDVGIVALRVRIGARRKDKSRVRELILTRCAPGPANDADRPPVEV